MATGSPNLGEAVRRATERARGLDLAEIAACVRDKKPEALGDAAGKRQRRAFLETLYSEDGDAERAYERIIGGNELQSANYLLRGAYVARTVLRIVIRSGGRLLGYGSGFPVGDGVLMTNNHVFPNSDIARNSEAEAFYELGILGEEAPVERFALEPDKLFYTSKELDFTIVAIAPQAMGSGTPLARIGWMPLIAEAGKVMEGEWLTIIQHPRGERKQLCVRENQLIKRDTDVLWYSTDTLGGASGSPVTTNDWLLVALHHSGVPKTVNGKWQTIDGRDFDNARDDESKIDWIANEGIRVSRIVETLRGDNNIANHPRIVAMLDVGVSDIRARLPVIFRDGDRPPELLRAGATPAPPRPDPPATPTEANMAQQLITVTLAVDDDGNVSLQGAGATESSPFAEAAAAPVKKKKNIIHAPVVPATDWIGGYDPAFLAGPAKADKKLYVHLPIVGDASKIAPLRSAYGQTFTKAEQAAGVLKYKGYSVVMNKDRRFAFFSAANVDGGMRPSISGREDDWLFDDRISRDHQVDNSFYKEIGGKKNRFDRGHLTRRDDMEWGSDPIDAVNRANGTCTWPNCAAQHEVFNQGKDKAVMLWQNLERYILEQTADANKFRVQVITGPIFGGADPEFRGIAYPLEYWKVVAAVTAKGELFATGYVLSQKDTIDRLGIEEAAVEVPFGAFGTYQRPISYIENLSHLSFTYGAGGKPLSEVDPLGGAAGGAAARTAAARRRGSGSQESFGAAPDDALASLDDVVLAPLA